MNTPEGDKEYTLHYYDYQNKGGDTIKHGNAIVAYSTCEWTY